jgi:hypothetical protein
MMRTGALDPDTIGRTARHLAAVTYCRPGHARSAAEAAIETARQAGGIPAIHGGEDVNG